MSQVLDFPAFFARTDVLRAAAHDDNASWPEPSALAPLDPANAPGRVLFEVLLVLATAGIFAVAVTYLVPGS